MKSSANPGTLQESLKAPEDQEPVRPQEETLIAGRRNSRWQILPANVAFLLSQTTYWACRLIEIFIFRLRSSLASVSPAFNLNAPSSGQGFYASMTTSGKEYS